MRYVLVIGAILLAFGQAGHTEAYRCEDANGHVMFSDEPCGENAEAIELETSAPNQSRRDDSPDADGAAKSQGSQRGEASEGENATNEDSGGETQASSNPCLDNRPDNEVLQGGTSESRIRAACGAPDRVTTGNEVFDKTLHYSDENRKMQIFINDGTKVGHNAL